MSNERLTVYGDVSDAQIAAIKAQKMKAVARHTPNKQTREKQAEICNLRLQGYNFSEIGIKLGMSPHHVHEQHRRAMQRIIQEPATEVREMEIHRLDAMLRELHEQYVKFFPVVNSGQVVRDVVDDENGEPVINEETQKAVTFRLEDIGPKMQILDRMLKIQDRRAKLLGLDAPVRRTLEGADGGAVKFDHNNLRGLSDAELTQMVQLMEKAANHEADSTPSGS